MFPLKPHIYFEVAAFLVALLRWRQLEPKILRWFVPFLFFIISVELYGRYLSKVQSVSNVWLYNLSIPVEYLFYSFIFYHHFQSAAFRRIALIFPLLFLAYHIIMTTLSGLDVFNDRMLIFGCAGMILLSILSLYDIYISDQSTPPWKLPIFWIAGGVLVFNLGEIIYFLFFRELERLGYEQVSKIFSQINNKVIYFLYSFLIIAFLCKSPKTSWK